MAASKHGQPCSQRHERGQIGSSRSPRQQAALLLLLPPQTVRLGAREYRKVNASWLVELCSQSSAKSQGRRARAVLWCAALCCVVLCCVDPNGHFPQRALVRPPKRFACRNVLFAEGFTRQSTRVLTPSDIQRQFCSCACNSSCAYKKSVSRPRAAPFPPHHHVPNCVHSTRNQHGRHLLIRGRAPPPRRPQRLHRPRLDGWKGYVLRERALVLEHPPRQWVLTN